MRAFLILAVVALAVEGQQRPGPPRRGPPHRRQFQGPPRGGPPFRGPPLPPPPGFRGPPPPPPPPGAFRPQGGPGFRPGQGQTLGQLPLNPRPEFDNPNFIPREEDIFSGEEVSFSEGDDFGPLFADDVQGPRQSHERFRDDEGSSLEATPFFQPDHDLPAATEDSHGAPETLVPHQQVEGPHQFEEETQEVVDVLSAPPSRRPRPPSQRPRPSQSRFPSHPNQFPLHNVIEEAPPQTRQRPLRDPLVEYQYDDEEGEDDEEEEEPDRLSILLQDSHFTCASKKNGYYADEEVDCEVFHYCQDSVKHSWLCPEGASFHQVHLICMPRSEDNICAKSSKFHFVNEFLYKEVEGENKTYADRYYPEGFEDGVANLDDGPTPVRDFPQHNEPIHHQSFVEDDRSASLPPRRPDSFLDRLPPSGPAPQQFLPLEEHPGRPFVERRPGQFARPPHPRPNGPQLGFQG
ncbi:proline-, glutamic acid- and leucine-rich protein 1-like [Penaeus indicus]|uniref:proline-, glutamic acid- and leucine-rich protein 1-like n=1 Tax=Penaeus indicus TaxID=29960 RepID=UPI00300D8E9B